MHKETPITTALVIDEPWIGYILDGKKTWEMRSTLTHKRGRIGLIRKGSGTIVGEATIVDSLPPLTPEGMLESIDRHCIPAETIRRGDVEKWIYPWVISDVLRYPEPRPYIHPNGAVTWVSVTATQPYEAARAEVNSRHRPAAEESTAEPSPRTPSSISTLKIRLTGGNIRNNHFYVTSCISHFPASTIGGKNKGELAREKITLESAHGEVIATDIDGTKNIFRQRAWVGLLFKLFSAKEGDFVILRPLGPLRYAVSIEKT